jgi:hypothetical protein
MGQIVSLHEGDHQRVPVKESRLPGEGRGRRNQWRSESQNGHAGGIDLVQCLSGTRQLLHFGGVAAKTIGDSLDRPAESVARLNRHHAVDNFPKDVRRGNGIKFLLLNPVKECLASGSILDVVR